MICMHDVIKQKQVDDSGEVNKDTETIEELCVLRFYLGPQHRHGSHAVRVSAGGV